VDALKAEGWLPRRVHLRQCKYLNNVVEQDHRTGEKARLAGKRLRLVCYGVADLTRDRSRQHDSKGQSEVAGEGRCRCTSGFHFRAIWHRRVISESDLTR